MKPERLIAFLPITLALASCTRPDPMGPPEIALDQTECVECGMIVSDERFACASIVMVEDGHTEPRVFDDINCLVLHEVTGHRPSDIVARWVHDKDTLAWINAERAHYVWSEDLSTPMMSHIAAFVELKDAESLRERLGGETLSFAKICYLFTPESLREQPAQGDNSPGTD